MRIFFTSFVISLAIVLICSFLFAGAIIIDFRGEPAYNKVVLKWTTQNEINLKGFEIERGLNENNFKKIDFVKASKENKVKKEYKYEDKSVFKTFERTFYYRLKIIDNDGKFSYSKNISVTPTVSSIRRTWGSIKAMFR